MDFKRVDAKEFSRIIIQYNQSNHRIELLNNDHELNAFPKHTTKQTNKFSKSFLMDQTTEFQREKNYMLMLQTESRGRMLTSFCACKAAAEQSPVSMVVLIPRDRSSSMASLAPVLQESDRLKIPAAEVPQNMYPTVFPSIASSLISGTENIYIQQ